MQNGRSSFSLNANVLVLNRFYAAVHVVSAKRAFLLLYRELAEVIHVEDGRFMNYDFGSWCEISEFRSSEKQDHEDWVRTVRFEIQVPRVVRLHHYDKIPKKTLRFNRRNLFARDDNRCQYCGNSLPSSQLSFDHVIPRSRGGQTSWENVVCACVTCNTKKGGRTPQEARMKLMTQPAKPRHSPLVTTRMNSPKYDIWKTFLTGSTSTVDVS